LICGRVRDGGARRLYRASILNRMIGDLKLAPGTVAPGKPTMMADEDENPKVLKKE